MLEEFISLNFPDVDVRDDDQWKIVVAAYKKTNKDTILENPIDAAKLDLEINGYNRHSLSIKEKADAVRAQEDDEVLVDDPPQEEGIYQQLENTPPEYRKSTSLDERVSDGDENGFVEDTARAVASGALKGISDIPRAFGILFDSEGTKDVADWIQSLVDEPDEEFANSTFGQVANGFGQIASLLAGGVAGAGAKLGSRAASKLAVKSLSKKAFAKTADAAIVPLAQGASMGGVEQVQDYYDTQREKGIEVDRSTELTSLFLGGAIGSFEALFPTKILGTGYVGKFAKSLDKISAKGRAGAAVTGAVVEGGTEALQSGLKNALGEALYDADNEIGEALNEALQEGKIGGILGGFMSAILPRGVRGRSGAKRVGIEPDAKTPIDETQEAQEIEAKVLEDEEVASADVITDSDRSGSIKERVTSVYESRAADPKYVASQLTSGQLARINEEAKIKQDKKEIFNAYRDNHSSLIKENNITSYDDLVTKSQEAAKKEIISILDDIGVDIKSDTRYGSLRELEDDVNASGGVSVGARTKGAFSDEMRGTGRTYGQGIDAIISTLGRLVSNSGFSVSGDMAAIETAGQAFSPLARIAINSYAKGAMASTYMDSSNKRLIGSIRNLDSQIKLDKDAGKDTEKSIAKRAKLVAKIDRFADTNSLLPESSTLGQALEIGDSNADAVTSRLTGVPQDRGADMEAYMSEAEKRDGVAFHKGRAFIGRKVLAGAELLKEKKVIAPKGAMDTALSYVATDVFLVGDPTVVEVQGDIAARVGAERKRAEIAVKKLGKGIDELVKNEDISKEDEPAFREGMLELVKDINNDTFGFALNDLSQPISMDNIRKNNDGDFIAQAKDGVGTVIVKKEIAEHIVAFDQVRRAVRKFTLPLIRDQLKERQDDLVKLEAELEQSVTRFVEKVVPDSEGGSRTLKHKWEEQEGWIDTITEPEAPERLYFEYLDGFVDDVASNATPSEGQTAEDAVFEEKTRLMSSFFSAMKEAKDINEFMDVVDDAFVVVDKDGNRSLTYQASIALGGYADSVEVEKSLRIQKKVMSQRKEVAASIAFLKTVEQNIGYMAVNYKAHHDDSFVETMLNPVTEEQKRHKEAYTEEQLDAIAAKEIGFSPQKIAKMLKTVRSAGNLMEALHVKALDKKSAIKSVDAAIEQIRGGFPKGKVLDTDKMMFEDKAEREAFAETIYESLVQDNYSFFRKRAESAVYNDIMKIRKKGKNQQAGSSYLPGGPAYAGASLKKDKQSKATQDFFGVITDIPTNMEMTINDAVNLSATIYATRELYDTTFNKSLFESDKDGNPIIPDDVDINVDDLVKVKTTNKFYATKFDKTWATKELAVTINSFSEGGEAVWLMRVLQTFTNQFKYTHTILNPMTTSINTLSGFLQIYSQGFNISALGEDSTNVSNAASMKQAWNVIFNREYADDLHEAFLAVGGSDVKQLTSIRARELSGDYLGRLLKLGEGHKVAGMPSKLWEKYNDIMLGYQQFGDFGPKIAAYAFNKEMLTRAFPTMSPERIKGLAKDMTRDTMNDHSRVPPSIKALQDNSPLAGGFLGFTTLVYSTAWHNFRWTKVIHDLEAVQYMRERNPDFKGETKEEIAQAVKQFRRSDGYTKSYSFVRARGAASSILLPAILAKSAALIIGGASALLIGDDEDDVILGTSATANEKEARDNLIKNINILSPEYYRNNEKALIGRDKNGALMYLNMSRVANYGRYTEAFNALFDDNPETGLDESVANSMKVLFGDFFNFGFGVQEFFDIYSGTDRFNTRIWEEEDSVLTKSLKSIWKVSYDAYTNRFFDKSIGLVGSMFEEDSVNAITGRKPSVPEFLLSAFGMKPITFDPVHELQSRTAMINRRIKNKRTKVITKMRSFSRVDDSTIQSYLAESIDGVKGEYDNMLVMIDSARELGVSDEQLALSLKSSSISKANIKLLLDGKRPLYTMGKRVGISRRLKAEGRVLPDISRSNLTSNYDRMRSILKQIDQ